MFAKYVINIVKKRRVIDVFLAENQEVLKNEKKQKPFTTIKSGFLPVIEIKILVNLDS